MAAQAPGPLAPALLEAALGQAALGPERAAPGAGQASVALASAVQPVAATGNYGRVRQVRMCMITVTSTDEAQPIARYTTDCASARLRRY